MRSKLKVQEWSEQFSQRAAGRRKQVERGIAVQVSKGGKQEAKNEGPRLTGPSNAGSLWSRGERKDGDSQTEAWTICGKAWRTTKLAFPCGRCWTIYVVTRCAKAIYGDVEL